MGFWNTIWVSHEDGLEGRYSIWSMKLLYDDIADKEEYPDFLTWLYDMERRAAFINMSEWEDGE